MQYMVYWLQVTLKQVKAWIHYNKRARDSRERPAHVRVAELVDAGNVSPDSTKVKKPVQVRILPLTNYPVYMYEQSGKPVKQY